MASNIESKLDTNISKVSKRHFGKQKCLTIINLYVIVKALKWAQSFSLCVKSCQSYQLSNPQKLFFKYSAISETWELWNLSYVIPIPLQYPSHPRWLKGLWELVLMYAGENTKRLGTKLVEIYTTRGGSLENRCKTDFNSNTHNTIWAPVVKDAMNPIFKTIVQNM